MKPETKRNAPYLREKTSLMPEEQEKLWREICFDKTEREQLSADAEKMGPEEQQEGFYHLYMEVILNEDSCSKGEVIFSVHHLDFDLADTDAALTLWGKYVCCSDHKRRSAASDCKSPVQYKTERGA